MTNEEAKNFGMDWLSAHKNADYPLAEYIDDMNLFLKNCDDAIKEIEQLARSAKDNGALEYKEGLEVALYILKKHCEID